MEIGFSGPFREGWECGVVTGEVRVWQSGWGRRGIGGGKKRRMNGRWGGRRRRAHGEGRCEGRERRGGERLGSRGLGGGMSVGCVATGWLYLSPSVP